MTISEDLQGRGLRATPFREELLSLLRAEGLPLSYQEIQGRFREKVDRVTLYRNLELLRTHGLVHQVQGLDGAWRFCAHDVSGPGCPGNHVHLLCVVCGRMECLVDQPLPRVAVHEGFEVEGKQLVVYGCCSGCREKKTSQGEDGTC